MHKSPLILSRLVAGVFTLASSLGILCAKDYVYFGTYTGRSDSEGIYRSAFDPASGELSEAKLAVEAADPNFLEIDTSERRLYSVEKSNQFEDGGAVASYRIDDSGSLELLNQQSSGGNGPCHVSVSPDGKIVAVANYSSGSVASYRVGDDGELSQAVSQIQHEGMSVDERRQKGPHAHSINFSPNGAFAYAADLGADKIFIYLVNQETGALAKAGEAGLAPGSGPRHFCFRPDGKFAYVINEMLLTVTAFRVDGESGMLEELQTISTLPEGAEKSGSTAEVVCHPSGKFLYGSNRGHDTIVVFAIDPETGKLTWRENEPIQGEVPRNFAVHPSGEWLLAAGQKSNTVSVFSIDAKTGELDYTGNRIEVFSPVCIRFLERD